MKNTIKKVEVSYVGEKNRLPVGTFRVKSDYNFSSIYVDGKPSFVPSDITVKNLKSNLNIHQDRDLYWKQNGNGGYKKISDSNNLGSFPSGSKFKSVPSVRKGSEDPGVAIFFDYEQINNFADEFNITLNYEALKNILLDGSGVANAYIDYDVHRKHLATSKENMLWDAGYIVKKTPLDKIGIYSVSNKYYQIIKDILFAVLENGYKNIIIIGGDTRLNDLVVELRERQIDISLVNFDEITDLDLKRRCDHFFSLNNVQPVEDEEEKEDDIPEEFKGVDENLEAANDFIDNILFRQEEDNNKTFVFATEEEKEMEETENEESNN
jgi:uncharacterized LabA/DUF88 family protein